MSRKVSRSSTQEYPAEENPQKLPLIRIRSSKSAQKSQAQSSHKNSKTRSHHEQYDSEEKKRQMQQCRKLLQRLKKITTQYHQRVSRRQRSIQNYSQSIDQASKTKKPSLNRTPGLIRQKKKTYRIQNPSEQQQQSMGVKKSARIPPQHWRENKSQQNFRTPRSLFGIQQQKFINPIQSQQLSQSSNKDLKRITVKKLTYHKNTNKNKQTKNLTNNVQQQYSEGDNMSSFQSNIDRQQDNSDASRVHISRGKNRKLDKKYGINKKDKLIRQLQLQREKRKMAEQQNYLLELQKYRQIDMVIDIEKQRALQRQKAMHRQFQKQRQRLQYELYLQKQRNKSHAISQVSSRSDRGYKNKNQSQHHSSYKSSHQSKIGKKQQSAEEDEGNKRLCQIIIIQPPVKKNNNGKTQYVVKTVS